MGQLDVTEWPEFNEMLDVLQLEKIPLPIWLHCTVNGIRYGHGENDYTEFDYEPFSSDGKTGWFAFRDFLERILPGIWMLPITNLVIRLKANEAPEIVVGFLGRDHSKKENVL